MNYKNFRIVKPLTKGPNKDKLVIYEVLVRDFDSDSNYQDLIDKMDNIENLEYIGVVQKEAKTELLSWGNVFCLPTYYSMEGQPISIIEAMGFGNVILTTKHAGIPDICSEKNGVFVTKRDTLSVLNQLEYLSNNLTWVKETGVYNMNQAQELYTEEAFVQGILRIFEEV